MTIAVGDTAEADAAIKSDPHTFSALIGDNQALERAIHTGKVDVMGDLGALRRTLQEVELSDG
jgi:hypothetical protein